jgi:hypothetical protein
MAVAYSRENMLVLEDSRPSPSAMTTLADLKRKLMRNPKFRVEYAKLGPEFAMLTHKLRATVSKETHSPPKRT